MSLLLCCWVLGVLGLTGSAVACQDELLGGRGVPGLSCSGRPGAGRREPAELDLRERRFNKGAGLPVLLAAAIGRGAE